MAGERILSANIAIEYYFLECSSEAYQHAKSAIRLLENMQLGSDIEKLRIGFLGERIDIYKLMVELCIVLDKKREAFDYVERLKSRALINLVYTMKIVPINKQNEINNLIIFEYEILNYSGTIKAFNLFCAQSVKMKKAFLISKQISLLSKIGFYFGQHLDQI